MYLELFLAYMFLVGNRGACLRGRFCYNKKAIKIIAIPAPFCLSFQLQLSTSLAAPGVIASLLPRREQNYTPTPISASLKSHFSKAKKDEMRYVSSMYGKRHKKPDIYCFKYVFLPGREGRKRDGEIIAVFFSPL